MSDWLGSLPLPEKLTVVPSLPLYGPPTTATGATLAMVAVVVPVLLPPSLSETRRATVNTPSSG